jgi:hypothetical protein
VELATVLVPEHLSTKMAMVSAMSEAALVLKTDLECDTAEEPVNNSHLLNNKTR